MNCLGFGVSVFGFRDWSLGFRVGASGFGVQGLLNGLISRDGF